MVDNGKVLSGKIRKTVYVEGMRISKAAVFQLLQQPGHLITGIPLAVGAKAIIGGKQQRKLLQLLRQGAFRLRRSGRKIGRRYTAALKFIHCVNQRIQKLRLGLHRGVCLQLAVQLPGSRCHGHYTPTFIQAT